MTAYNEDDQFVSLEDLLMGDGEDADGVVQPDGEDQFDEFDNFDEDDDNVDEEDNFDEEDDFSDAEDDLADAEDDFAGDEDDFSGDDSNEDGVETGISLDQIGFAEDGSEPVSVEDFGFNEVDESPDELSQFLEVEDIDTLLSGVKFERNYGEVSIDSLVVSEISKNVRQRTIKGLTASVADMNRVLNPIDVLKMPSIEGMDDQYMVISGLRRMYGAIRNGFKKVPAFIWEFQDFENASKLSFLLGLVINKQQAHDMQEVWVSMQHLEREYNLKPAQVERLFPNLQGGDAMRLKDVALGEYAEPRDLLFSGEKTLDQSYKLLQKLRKEADDLEMEDNTGILSDTELGQETVVDDSEKDNLSPEEVMSILEMDEDIDLDDDAIFGESADAGHHQDRGGDGDDDLSVESKNRIKMRDQMLCRACTRLEEKDEQGRPYVKINPEKANDAAGFNSLLTVHHIIPVHAGGTDDDENLITLCLQCHHRLHVMEKMGTIMVDEETFRKMSAEMQQEIKAAYYYARKAIKAGQMKGYNRKQRQELASKSLRHKFPGMEIKNDTALLGQMTT